MGKPFLGSQKLFDETRGYCSLFQMHILCVSVWQTLPRMLQYQLHAAVGVCSSYLVQIWSYVNIASLWANVTRTSPGNYCPSHEQHRRSWWNSGVFRLSSAWWQAPVPVAAGQGEPGAGGSACGVSLAPHNLVKGRPFHHFWFCGFF